MRQMFAVAAATVLLAGCSISVAGTMPDTHGRAMPIHVRAKLDPLRVASTTPSAHLAATGPNSRLASTDQSARSASGGAAGTPDAPPDATGGIDLTSALRTAVALPERIATFQRTVMACAVALLALGILNLALTLALLLARRSERAPVTSVASASPSESSSASSSVLPVERTTEAARDAAPHDVAEHAVAVPSVPDQATRMSARCACGEAVSARSRSGRCRRCARAARPARRPSAA